MLAASTLLFALACQAPQEPAYDPLAVPAVAAPEPLALTATDATRNRTLPLRVYLPAASTKAPVVLWSHGLGGSCENSPYLGRHWAARGYVAVFVQHPGSDESVWKDVPMRDRMTAMQKAASTENLQLRYADVKFVLDQLTTWNADDTHALHDRLDLDHIGMSGHSFGALTTQGVAGQSVPLLGAKWTDARIDAALPMSPSSPRVGKPEAAFGKVAVPWLLMTGTLDDSPIGGQTPESRREVYPALPATIDRYELVLHEALHSAFSERALPGDRGKRNPNHHRAILALSTAFWDTYLRSDPAAKQWLQGDGARSVLEEKDAWQAAKATTTTAR
jgi:dienelactone hydrolase